MKLRIVVERITNIELPFPIKVAIQQLLIILKFKEKDSNKSKILELTLLDAQEHIWITEEHLFVAEEGRKVAEEQVRIFEERIKVAEEQKQQSEEKQRILEDQKEQIEQSLIIANKEKNISEEIAKAAQERILIVEEEKKAFQEQKREIEEQLKISEEKTRIEEMHLKEVQDQVTAKDSQIEHLLAEVAQLKHQPVQTIEHGDDTTAELSNPDSSGQGMSLERVSGLLRKAVALKQEFLVVSLNKEIKNGIRSLTVRFGKCNFLGFAQGYVGIAKSTYKIPYPCIPNVKPHCQNMLGYLGLDGEVCYKGQSIKGNSKFKDGQLITLELNYDDGTLHIFADRKQQPIFVKGIKEAVKFWFQIWNVGSSFEIISVKKLENSTASKLQPNQKAINW
ncbi:MAG: hypothetical protein EZS28_029912 [Streblomastix strix]|uniref:Uncharacterized protein n=1 Tax=Streblomastix strix TaxID=222440 RepID=A0A5J4UWV2_9EUKA|nr:MAG: hypothetical protein EZS28_029912 [Streblomastix strix]